MFITKILTDIPLIIISAVFITSLVYTIKKYREISTVLKSLCQSLLNYNFNNLSYRFVEFKALMRQNYITRNSWNEFNDLDFSLGPNPNQFKAGVGVGLRFTTPSLPIRIDWGYGLNHEAGEDRSHFYFNMSNMM